jgi:hypothetical protein
VRELCGKVGVNSMTLCRPSRTASTPRPSKEDGGTLERGTAVYPAPAQDDTVTSDQRSASPPSLRPCAATPATVPSSRALQHHPRHRRSPGRRDTATPAAVHPPALCQPNPRADVPAMTKQEAPTPPPLKPLLDRHRTRHDAR